MSKGSMSDKALFNVANIVRSYGFLEQSSIIDILYRVIMTKKALSGKGDDCDTVYHTMQEVSATLPRFPGDADLFFAIYNILSPLNERDILSFINIANDEREVLAPDVLIEKLSEYIEDDTSKVLVAECEQYGPSVFDVIESNPKVQFTLIFRQAIKASLLSVVYAEIKNVKLLAADIYSYGFTNEKYDQILCIPLFGGRALVNGEDFISREPDLIAALSHQHGWQSRDGASRKDNVRWRQHSFSQRIH